MEHHHYSIEGVTKDGNKRRGDSNIQSKYA